MNRLKQYFPVIRERQELLTEIRSVRELEEQFESWTKEQQEDFLNLCTGVRGIRFLYDGFFKEIMNPEYVPERLNDFLSQALGKRVRVLKVLPADSVRLADENSLLIMDMVVEFEDGGIANLEIQKVGYLFPGQRSACYSADLLLRQYKRVRGERRKKFSYRDIRSVYTIVLYEKSPGAFHRFPHEYKHNFEQKSDTGLEMELLQKYLFIPLDIFRKIQQNKDITDKLEAWLAAFSIDDPETIIQLLERYPEFRQMYEEAYDICRNIEEVMAMFSRELYELDKNTVQYMIDEMQDTIDEQKTMLDTRQNTIDEQKAMLDIQRNTIKTMQDVVERGILGMIRVMEKSGSSKGEILEALQEQYQLTGEAAEGYLEQRGGLQKRD